MPQITVRRPGFDDGYAQADVSAALTAAGYTLDAMYGEQGRWVFLVSNATESERTNVEAVIDDQYSLTGGVVPAQRLPSDSGGTLRVLNISGGAAAVGDVGMITHDGYYLTTTVAKHLIQWCVVVAGGNNNADITVVTSGRVPVNYTGAAPAEGDLLVTSTVAGRAQAQTYRSPEIFAICSEDGVGGTVMALLLTKRAMFVSPSNAGRLFGVAGSSTSSELWTGSINASPTVSPVTIATTGGKNLNTITPVATSNFAGTVIRNTTRGTEAILASRSGNDFTFTDDADLAGWQNGDALTAVSSLLGNNVQMVELKFDVIVPAAVGMIVNMVLTDTGGTGGRLYLLSANPANSYSDYNTHNLNAPVASIRAERTAIVGIYNRRFGIKCDASAASSASYDLWVSGWIEAAP